MSSGQLVVSGNTDRTCFGWLDEAAEVWCDWSGVVESSADPETGRMSWKCPECGTEFGEDL